MGRKPTLDLSVPLAYTTGAAAGTMDGGGTAAMIIPKGGDGAAEGPLRFPIGDRDGRTASPALSKGISGRRFVILACLGVLALWGGLYLAFAGWRARYEALAEFGRAEVARAIDPMERLHPPGIDPRAWIQAVADTHTMLIGLTSSGLLDLEVMTSLRDDVRSRVARSTPDTALSELAGLWEDLEVRAGPVISSDVAPVNPNSRHAQRISRPPRPSILPQTKAASRPNAT